MPLVVNIQILDIKSGFYQMNYMVAFFVHNFVLGLTCTKIEAFFFV